MLSNGLSVNSFVYIEIFRTLEVEQREGLINSVPDEENDVCSSKNEHLS